MNPLDMIVAEVDKLVGQFVAPFLARFGIPQNLVTPLVVGLVTTALTIYLFSSISKSGSNGTAAAKKTRSSSRFVDSISLPVVVAFQFAAPVSSRSRCHAPASQHFFFHHYHHYHLYQNT